MDTLYHLNSRLTRKFNVMQNEIPYPRDSGIQHAQDSGSRARLLHLSRSFTLSRLALTFSARRLHFAARLFNAGAGDPSQPP